MEKEGNGVPNSKSHSGQPLDFGTERNAPSRSATAILGGPRRGRSPWARSTPTERALPTLVTRNPRLLSRPVVRNLEEDFCFQEPQPQVVRNNDDSCFLDIKSAITPHTPDGTALLVTTPTTEANDEGNAVTNTSAAKRGSTALSDDEKKRRNREYAKRHRMKSLEAKSRQEQYIAELENQLNSLYVQVEAGRARILELEEQVESMSAMAARFAILEEQVKNLEEENRRLLIAQEIRQTTLTTTSPAVDGRSASTVDLGTSLDPLNFLTPHEPVATQGFSFFERR